MLPRMTTTEPDETSVPVTSTDALEIQIPFEQEAVGRGCDEVQEQSWP